MSELLDPKSPKTIFQSKTFWANVIPVVATLVGSRWPVVGDFVNEYGLQLVGLLGAANVGLRVVTKEPVVLKVEKRF